MTADTLGVADIHKLLEALPQRYPLLMVDKIINIRGDESAIGIKNVTVNEPQFLLCCSSSPAPSGCR